MVRDHDIAASRCFAIAAAMIPIGPAPVMSTPSEQIKGRRSLRLPSGSNSNNRSEFSGLQCRCCHGIERFPRKRPADDSTPLVALQDGGVRQELPAASQTSVPLSADHLLITSCTLLRMPARVPTNSCPITIVSEMVFCDHYPNCKYERRSEIAVFSILMRTSLTPYSRDWQSRNQSGGASCLISAFMQSRSSSFFYLNI